ncbi:MAG: DUF2141 domain-containing protein [Candidatus Latescibacteria bacterium]|nr:DUF2141 domain-containing protein [Candidatus Latescibacterota bacterium]
MKYFFCIVLFILISFNVITDEPKKKGMVKIVITGFKNDEGVARIALFRDKHGFPNDTEYAYLKGECDIQDNESRLSINNIEYSTYAVSVYHDENNNGKLDKKWKLIPSEGFGTSNNARKEKEGPSYDLSTFEVNADTISVKIKLEYLFDR